jgi:hypothetical protein
MNSLNLDLAGKTVVLSEKFYDGDTIGRVFLCKGGFGCQVFLLGKAIGGEFIADGETCRVEGNEVERLATQEEIEEANKRRSQSGKAKSSN